jgi:HK97 family phage prohead protease
MKINKKLKILSDFSVEKSAESDELRIVGYANTTTKDRVGDVVAMEAWTKGGLDNFKQNPIILAYHNHSRPIGVAESLSIDEKGLKITARISKAAGEVYQLVQEGILKAFSIGFQTKDADYDSITDIFVIKDLELLEISVVSIPANQDSLFSVSKGFDSEADYLEFKKSFNPPEETLEEIAKEQETQVLPEVEEPKEEEFMDKEELQKMIAEATSAAVTKGIEVLLYP